MMKNLPFFWSTKTLILDDDSFFLEELKEILGKKPQYIFFTNPKEAIAYLDKQDFQMNWYIKNPVSTKMEESHYNINYDLIPSVIANDQRFNLVSNVIVDYHMPTMSGVEFCQQIQSYKFLRKTLLTSSIDLSEAIKNLNSQTINSFLDKKTISKKDFLKNHITEQEIDYFSNVTSLITESILVESNEHPFLSKEYNNIINNIILDYKIQQYYLVNKSGTYLMVDSNNNRYNVFLLSDDDIEEMELEAKDNNLDKAIYLSLKSKSKAICFYDRNNTSDWPHFSQWKNHLHPIKAFSIGGNKYYYSIVRQVEN